MTIIHKLASMENMKPLCDLYIDSDTNARHGHPHRFTTMNKDVTCADCDSLLADNTTSSENTQPANLNDELKNAESWATSAKQELSAANDKVSRLAALEHHLQYAAQYLEPGETYSLPDYDIHVTRM